MHRLSMLPINEPINSLEVYKELSAANINLGELKGVMSLIPNKRIILKIISMMEAKSSAEIESSNTEFDEFFMENVTRKNVHRKTTNTTNCMRAMNIGYKNIMNSNEITFEDLLYLQQVIEPDRTGVRKSPGLKILKKNSSEVVYIPPQDETQIKVFISNIENYINNDLDDYDPLIKMSLIHFQFECIHPFVDGNGRIGRILNTLFLILKQRLDYPLINLSKYLHETSVEYYNLLAKCHYNTNHIEEFVIYILKGIKTTSRFTIDLILHINNLMETTNYNLKNLLPEIYNDEIAKHLFRYLYTKNELFRTDLKISRSTATKYLKALENKGFIKSVKIGKEVLYRNVQLDNIFYSS